MEYKKKTNEIFFYINDDLTTQMNGIKNNEPFPVNSLRAHDAIKPFLLGFCSQTNTRYKGKIADVKIFNTFKENVMDAIDGETDLVLRYDFSKLNEVSNIDVGQEDIEVIENILPFRREGNFYCLPHIDEGFMNGTWAKGETTAKNEKRLVTQMQQGKINYKEDGMSNLKYELINTEMVIDNCLMINVKL
jgi:hypothetical protein